MSNENVPKTLQIQMLIYSPCGKTLIDTRNRNLIARKSIDDVAFYECCGAKNLGRDFFREVKIFKTVKIPDRRSRRGFKTEHKEIEKVSGFALIAKHMSIQLPVTKGEVKRLLVPYLEKGVQMVYVFTKAGSLGLPSMIQPEWCRQKYGFRNKWCASGSRPFNNWTFVNDLLRERNSPYRVLTSSLDLGAEKELGIEVELKKALKRIEQLERGST